MSEKEQVLRETATHTGLFDFTGFYSFAHDWLKEEKRYGVVEERYSEKVSGNSRDLMIEWRATRQLSDYFKLEIFIRFIISGMTDVEVEIDGNKSKMNKGKVDMDIRGALVKDPESKWDSAPFTRFMRDVYNKYVIPSRIYDMEMKVRTDVSILKDELKAFMEVSARKRR
jgi:hypothetical protein